jgi:D-glycero-alpha-D-manno-heptose-7-phosphate kinase
MSRRLASGMAQYYDDAVRITASAPTRIDFAGGTIDIWPLYLFHHGAQTVNAAISLRAHVEVTARADQTVEIISEDTERRMAVESAADLRGSENLPLLGKLAAAFGAHGVTIRTHSESPAGAGIAGSSALNVAVCGALAKWAGCRADSEQLLTTAMNVEAQAIRVPTGLQDYRPAMYGGIAALELGEHGLRRVALDVDPGELARRIVLCYTGAPRNSGTNNWDIVKRHIDGDRRVFDCFERIRDIAAAMRDALARGDWDATARHLADEWDNRKRLAPGVTTPQIDDLIARARAGGAQAAKVCGAGGGGCLFCIAPLDRVAAVREALARGGARLLDFRIETEGLRVNGA